MRIETDLKIIEQLGEEKFDENWEFRSFLKQHPMDSDELDALVHQITTDVSSQIDCTKCANCCNQIGPVLDKKDISLFAKGLKVPITELDEKYLILHEDRPSKYKFKERPCPFLKDKRCSNYDHRPKDCRSYPHLHKDDFVSRLWGVVSNFILSAPLSSMFMSN